MTEILLNNYNELETDAPVITDTYGEDENSITITQFKHVLDFVEDSGENSLTIRGGSPMKHEHVNDLLLLASERRSIEHITILTDATFNPRKTEIIYLLSLEQPVQVVVNLLPPNEINKETVDTISRNLSQMSRMGNVGMDVRTIFNDPRQQHAYVQETIKNNNFNNAHVGIAPSIPERYNGDLRKYVDDMRKPVYEFFMELSSLDVDPQFETIHHLPICAFTDGEISELSMSGVDISKGAALPQPAIHPDMTVTRTYDYLEQKVSLSDFNTRSQLVEYFKNNVDPEYIQTPIFDECEGCHIYQRDGISCPSIRLQAEATET